MMLNAMQTPVIPAPRHATAPSPFSRLQWEAIRIGIKEGDVTLTRSRCLGFLWLFMNSKTRPLADTCLEALRAYAELARTLVGRGKNVPTTTLEEAGFSKRQIAALNRAVLAPAGAV